MSLPFAERPDAAEVVALTKETTGEGLPCQIHAVIQFKKDGLDFGKGSVTINPGNLERWGVPDHEAKFEALWDAVPSVPQPVLDTVSDQLPKVAYVEAWR